jgi:bacillithiol biosynthesis deacetylase BshB1
MPLDLLAFGAHPDDADIAYGGTLRKMAKKGYKVGVCDLTGGERGTRGSRESRQQELAVAAEILGLTTRRNLEIPDTQVAVTRENQLKVIRLIRELKPRTVLLAPNDERHPDHTAAERLTFEGSYFAGLTNFDESLTDLEAHRPFKVLRVHGWRSLTKPSFIVDISDELEDKIAAVKAFTTQFPHDEERKDRLRDVEIEDWLRSRARYYGMIIGKKYGEAFIQREVFEVDDLITMPVRSM